MSERRRRTTPKCMLEKAAGKSLAINILPAAHKVQILEYLLSCPAIELNDYQTNEWPNFVYEASRMLIDGRMLEYIKILDLCRKMEREDNKDTDITN